MDLQARIEEIQARINRLRKIIEQGELENYREPEPVIEEPVKEPKVNEEQLKRASELDALRSKLTRKK